jgi:PhoD-like phosphatase
MARELVRGTRSEPPHILLLLGDQVYVDEGAPRTRERIRDRRGGGQEPGEHAADFEEYTWLYHEAWSDPLLRWLMSTVSCSMVWDDHDMHDDWNISRSWLEEMKAKDWWWKRVHGGLMSYWLYQYAGNLSPAELEHNEVWQRIEPGGDATEVLSDFAHRAHQSGDGARWTFCRDIGRSRLIVIEDRAGRVLEEDRRAIVDDEEWDWIVEHAQGDFDHLLLATTDPFLLAPAMHYLEAWNERVCDGAWGAASAKAGEKLRRALDLDHWGAFGESFGRLAGLIEEVGAGRRGEPPASIVLLSGDVHHAYLAEVAFRRGSAVRSAVYQAVCSPFRNPLDARERRTIEASLTRPVLELTRMLASAAGAPEPPLRWRFAEGPCFDNQVATIRLDGRAAAMKLEKTVAGEEDERHLERSFERELASGVRARVAQP